MKALALAGFNIACLLCLLVSKSAAELDWSVAAAWPSPRENMSAVVVDGKIFVIGGSPSRGTPDEMDFYNTKTNSWRRKSQVPRNGAKGPAVAGAVADVTGAVDVYDPESNSWSKRAPMPTARKRIASAVVGGRIYVAGGYGRTGSANVLEVYDPRKDSWTSAAPLPVGGEVRGIALDNLFYVVGGTLDRDNCTQPTVEAFDTKSGAWLQHEATFPGRLCAPYSISAHDGLIYVLSRTGHFQTFNPRTDQWTSVAGLGSDIGEEAITAFGGRIYSFGGSNARGDPASHVAAYDPAKDAWTTMGELPRPRRGSAAVASGKSIYVVGGSGSDAAPLVEVDVISPATDAPQVVQGSPWEFLITPTIERFAGGGAVVDRQFCVFGGYLEHGSKPVGLPACYDPKTGTWQEKTDATSFPTSAIAGRDGKLYLAGGMNEVHPSPSVMVVDLEAKNFDFAPAMPTPRSLPAAAIVGEELFVVGGLDVRGQVSGAVEAYNTRNKKWRSVAALPVPMFEARAAVVDGILYVFSGKLLAGTGVCGTVVFSYDRAADHWVEKASMPSGGCSLVAVSNGWIYTLNPTVNGVHKNLVSAYDPKADRWYAKSPLPGLLRPSVAGGIDGRIYIFAGGISERNTLIAYDPSKDPIGPSPQPKAPISVESPRLLVSDVDSQPAAGTLHPHDFALVVGVEKYRAVPTATFAERDAGTFKRYAESILGVPKDNVIYLDGQRASRSDIAKYLEEWLPRNVVADSRVYFYFAGHGAVTPENGDTFLVPWDGDSDFLKTSAVSTQWLYKQLEDLKAKDAVVILDSCYSGEGGRSLSLTSARPLINVADPALPKGSHLTVLTAVTGHEIAGTLESQGHGIFTYYLLKGIRGDAVKKKGGHVELSELYEYVRQSVHSAANRQNRTQTPGLHTSRLDLNFY